MQSYKVIGLKMGNKFIGGKPFKVNGGTLTARTEEEESIINGSNAYKQGNIIPVADSELSLDAASILLQEKLKEISFFLTMDELQRLKNLPEPNRSEAVKVLKGNFYDVLEHYESTGVVNEDDETPPVITDDPESEVFGPGEQETPPPETLKGDFPPKEGNPEKVADQTEPPVDANLKESGEMQFTSKFSDENTVKELKAFLEEWEVSYDKHAKKEELLALAILTEKKLPQSGN